MKVKVSELSGTALDWAVSVGMTCDSESLPEGQSHLETCHTRSDYSVSWAHGGPLIERANISLGKNCPKGWKASMSRGVVCASATGETPLLAAMRCYVLVKLGEEVEVPDPLV